MPAATCPCCTIAIFVEAPADWLSCPKCAHRWRTNGATAEPGYYQGLISRNDTSAPWFARKLAERTEALQLLISPKAGRVLEIGCAEGLLGAHLKAKRDICYDGIELSRDAAVAANRLDHVFKVPAAEVSAPAYDLIASFHVLEHITDVAAEIRSWLRLLGSEGRVLIEVPNRAGHPLLVQDANREHLHQFCIASLACLLERCGLDIDQITRGHRESPVYPDSLRVIARLNATPAKRRERLLASFAERLSDPFAIYGIGGDFENYILPLLDDLPVVALLDSAPEKQGRKIAGRRIEAYAESTHGGIPLLISSIRFGVDIRLHLQGLGIEEHLIVGLEEIYDPS
ncbi:MAG: class I SAM-dependent methyltransferase [Betaproteobacteria bacterium HGW-Betaproteobacteria-7]|jgi:SAM-dependent methyltransferase|nr:MAG: class I SAM-dependent methyltransferase [Betaproteobacteria bacterium HGW-Betaproteobacteria-7]